MGANTKIEWCDFTFNPWRGCQKVAAGCVNCYAEAQSKRNPRTLGVWGPSGTRVVASESMWRQPVKWNRDADPNRGLQFGEKMRPRVFCGSMCDVFEDWGGTIQCGRSRSEPFALRIDRDTGEWVRSIAAYDSCRMATIDDVRERLFRLIDSTPNLDWLVLTKRPENIRRMIEACGSIGYNTQHEHSSRTIRVSSGSVWRTGSRRTGKNLEGQEAPRRPMERRNKDDSMQESSSGNAERKWLSSNPVDAESQEGLCGSSPSGVDSLQRSDTGWTDCQSQVRDQGRQQAERIGACDAERAATSRYQSSRCEALGREGIEASENEIDGDRCSEDSRTPQIGMAGQGHCRHLRNEVPRDQRDMLSSHMDSRSVGPFYRSNVWLGTSIACQEDADRNIPELLKCRDLCAKLFLSIEPLVGPVDLLIDGECSGWACHECGSRNVDTEVRVADDDVSTYACGDCGYVGGGEDANWKSLIDWVIVGGESGPNARPCDIAWIRSIVRQCREAGVPVFVKQLGSDSFRVVRGGPAVIDGGVAIHSVSHEFTNKFRDPKGGDPAEWPEDVRVREVP